MSISPVIAQADLELKMGGNTVLGQYTNDANGKTPDPVIVAYVLQVASDEGAGALRSSFTATEIAALVAADTAVKDAFASIGAGICGARRPQMRDERGRTMWFDERARANSFLKEMAKADNRSIAEGQGDVPVNPLTQNETNYPRPVSFAFAQTSDKPCGHGGF